MNFQYNTYAEPLLKNPLNSCSRHSTEYPLMVNCTGNVDLAVPFTTDNPSGREDYYLLYMVKGMLNVSLPGGTQTLRSGQAVLFPPKYHYRYVYDGAESLNYLWVHFTGSYAEQFLRECGFFPLPFVCPQSDDTRIVGEFHRLFEYFERDGAHLRQKRACALERLLLTLADDAASETEGAGTLEKSLRYIHAAYHTDLRIPELAKMENLSHSRYIALFQKKTGLSPVSYIVQMRIRTACDLLRNTDMSVKQIGLLVGYEDPHFFSKLFKKHVGLPPQEYRKDPHSPSILRKGEPE